MTYDWLTVARAFFVTWIILRHISADGGLATWIRSVCPSINVFDVPTNFFFLLSGVMFSTGRPMSSEPGSNYAFWRSRLVRLAPIYLLAVLISAPIGWKSANGDVQLFIASGIAEALFLQGFFTSLASWNMTGWFMSSIAFCYLAYPLIVRRIQDLSTRRLCLVYCACAIYCILAAIFAGIIYADHDQAQAARRLPILSLPMFINGIVIGLLIKRAEHLLLSIMTLAVAVLAVAAAAVWVKNGIYLFIAAAIWPPVLLALVHIPISAPETLKRMGELAFILYALHWPLYVYVKGLASLYPSAYSLMATPLGTILFLIALVAIAEAARRWFEQPILDRLRRRDSSAT